MVFSGWENDLEELSVIDVIPIDVLDKIRAEIREEFSRTDRFNREYKEGLNRAFFIIDKYISGEVSR